MSEAYLIDVYLSPSTQEHNACILGDVEETHENIVCDNMVPYLTASGVTFARNDRYKMTHYESMLDSNRKKARVHLAIHSNANSSNPNVHGQRCYRNPLKAECNRFADILVELEKQIYRDPAACRTCIPAIKYTEIYSVKAPICAIDEIGYHTNREDAEWIHKDAKAIGKNLAQAACKVLGKPFVDIDLLPKPKPSVINPFPVPDRLPKYGNKDSDAVRWLQWQLIAQGSYLGKYGPAHDGVDGDFGDLTRAALAAYQKKAGVSGADTILALLGKLTWTRYVVKPGDTLWSITTAHGLPGQEWQRIRREDGKDVDIDALIPGTVLLIPRN